MATPAKSKTETLNELMVEVFRVNARLLEHGDRLVEPLRLNSARWQLLGAVALAGQPLTAPQIAQAMGVTRQGAQKQLNRMLEEGLFTLRANPHHLRSPLYALSPAGRQAYESAMALNAVWAGKLAEGLKSTDLECALRVLASLCQRLDTPALLPGASP